MLRNVCEHGMQTPLKRNALSEDQQGIVFGVTKAGNMATALYRFDIPVFETKQKSVRTRNARRHQSDAITRLNHGVIGSDGFAIDEYDFDALHGDIQFGHQSGSRGFPV